jgi:hypothetical protein
MYDSGLPLSLVMMISTATCFETQLTISSHGERAKFRHALLLHSMCDAIVHMLYKRYFKVVLVRLEAGRPMLSYLGMPRYNVASQSAMTVRTSLCGVSIIFFVDAGRSKTLNA